MNDEIRNNIFMLSSSLKKAIVNNNKVMREFCSALLTKYLEEGIEIYNLIPKEEFEKESNLDLKTLKKENKNHILKD